MAVYHLEPSIVKPLETRCHISYHRSIWNLPHPHPRHQSQSHVQEYQKYGGPEMM